MTLKEIGVSEYWVNKKTGDKIELKLCLDDIIFLRKGKEIYRLKSSRTVFRINVAWNTLRKNGYVQYDSKDQHLEEEAVKLDKFLAKEVAEGNTSVVKH